MNIAFLTTPNDAEPRHTPGAASGAAPTKN